MKVEGSNPFIRTLLLPDGVVVARKVLVLQVGVRFPIGQLDLMLDGVTVALDTLNVAVGVQIPVRQLCGIDVVGNM